MIRRGALNFVLLIVGAVAAVGAAYLLTHLMADGPFA